MSTFKSLLVILIRTRFDSGTEKVLSDSVRESDGVDTVVALCIVTPVTESEEEVMGSSNFKLTVPLFISSSVSISTGPSVSGISSLTIYPGDSSSTFLRELPDMSVNSDSFDFM